MSEPSRNCETSAGGAVDPIHQIAATLELIASERPKLLRFVLEIATEGAPRFALHQLAAEWGVELKHLASTVRKACADLDQLERCRRMWRDPGLVVERPNAGALLSLAKARATRVPATSRQRRMEAITRRLLRVQEEHRIRRWITEFLSPPEPLTQSGASTSGEAAS